MKYVGRAELYECAFLSYTHFTQRQHRLQKIHCRWGNIIFACCGSYVTLLLYMQEYLEVMHTCLLKRRAIPIKTEKNYFFFHFSATRTTNDQLPYLLEIKKTFLALFIVDMSHACYHIKNYIHY